MILNPSASHIYKLSLHFPGQKTYNEKYQAVDAVETH